MSLFHRENGLVNVYNDDFELNSIVMPLGALKSQYEDSISHFVDSLVISDSTHFQQPSADHAAL